MITPGPVVITAAFIGYLVAGAVGATIASVAVFLPPYLVVIAAAPYYRRFARNPQVRAFVQGVTAAAVGAIVGATYVLPGNSAKRRRIYQSRRVQGAELIRYVKNFLNRN